LRVGCHWAATFGNWVARSLTPATVVRPEQTGQPDPAYIRLWTFASHSCPCSQRHHTLSPQPPLTWLGVRVSFFVGCHWAATFGNLSAND